MAVTSRILASIRVKNDIMNAGIANIPKVLSGVSSIGFQKHLTNGVRFSSSTTETCPHPGTTVPTADTKRPSTNNEILPASKIPGFPILPIVGSIPSLMLHKDFDNKRMYKMFQVMARQFGPIFRLKTPGMPPTVFFTRPDDIEKMLSVTALSSLRTAFFSLKSIRDNAEGDFFQKKSGILPENGDEWKRVRLKVQQPILFIPNIQTYLPTMDQVALDFVERIIVLRNDRQEVPEDFQTEMYKWALESVATVALNKRLGCLDKDLQPESYQMKLIDAVNDFFKNMQQMDLFPVWRLYTTKRYRRMKECHDYIVKIADESVRKAEEGLKQRGSSDSNLTLLESYLRTEGLSRTDVTTFMTDLFIAGIDTTSHSIAFTLFLLARNPESQKILQKELDSILGDGKGELTPKHLSSMSYLKECVKESLRLYPVALGIARTFDRDVVIDKYLIPKGWQGVSLGAVCTRYEDLFRQPDQFLPERWQRTRPHGPINPFASLPFSHGSRGCVGRRIAEQEMYVLLARVCHRFNVEYHYDDFDPFMHVVLSPDKPLKFKFTERR